MLLRSDIQKAWLRLVKTEEDQWLKHHASTARGMGTTPGQVVKIPHATWLSQNMGGVGRNGGEKYSWWFAPGQRAISLLSKDGLDVPAASMSIISLLGALGLLLTQGCHGDLDSRAVKLGKIYS